MKHKLCKDCKHLLDQNCRAPRNIRMVPNFINGGEREATGPRYFYAAQNCRESDDACSIDAKWFEPKAPA